MITEEEKLELELLEAVNILKDRVPTVYEVERLEELRKKKEK